MELMRPLILDTSACSRGPAAKEGYLALTSRLQTTLRVEEVLGIFFEEVGPLFALQGLDFRHALGENHLGKRTGHRCRYRLTLEERELGELTCYRDRPFEEETLARFERWLCTLVYPLRNALLYQEALHRSLKDPLTGVGNRTALEEAIRREVEFAHRYRLPLSLAILDVDHFKAINDRHGHLAGDCVLRHLVERIQRHVRKTDLVFRYGGEEFAILVNAGLKDAARVAERIRREVESEPYLCQDGRAIPITVSIGVAALSAGEAPMRLFERADKALYMAKQAGRNRLTLASSP